MTSYRIRNFSFRAFLVLVFALVGSTTWAAPAITKQPAPRQVPTRGTSVTLDVEATGSGALSYQWSHGGLPIAGATASSLTLTNVQYKDRGSYLVKVTDSTGTTLSGTGFLNVLISPAGLRAWSNGSSGIGTFAYPVGLNGVVALATNKDHSLALKADGTVVGWGDNSDGEISVPAGLSDVVDIATTDYLSVALKSDGMLVCWGIPFFAAQGNGISNVVAIAVNGRTVIAIKADGTFVTFNGSTMIPAGLSDVAAISFTTSMQIVLKTDGTIGTWGISHTLPANISGVVAVIAGDNRGYALKSDGTVITWTATGLPPYLLPEGLSGVTGIATAGQNNYAIKADGTVIAWTSVPFAGIKMLPLPEGLSGVSSITTSPSQFDELNLAIVPLFPLLIATQPDNLIKNPGSSAAFNVAVTGSSPLTYQWRKNGQNISGATLPTYAISSVQENHEGSYDVVITNELGAITSNVATLSVNDPVVLTASPQSLTVIENQVAAFSVAAIGTAPFSYQWKKNGVNINGATSAILSIASAKGSDAGNYSCQVSNAVGSVITNAAELVVVEFPVISVQPLSRTIIPGVYITLAVESPTKVVNFQWRKDGVNIDSRSAFCLVLTSEATQGVYDVVLSNAAGTVTSNQAILDVSDPIQITAQPVAKTVNPAASVSLSVSATGAGPITYQWRKNLLEIGGATTASYSIAAVQESNEGSYDVVVTNVVGSVTSSPAALSVNNPIQITAQPAAKTVNPAASASFIVSATGTGLITYQWRKDLVEISGATNASYSIASVQESNEGSYDVMVTNLVGSVTSTPAILSVNDPIQITAQPAAKTVNPAASASFSVSATGTGPFTYQWRKNSLAIGGATSASYSIASVQESNEGSYDVVVTNAVSSVTSTPAVLSVNDPIQITAQPIGKTVNPAALVSFGVSATGTGPITYQWRKNSVAISGATSASYSIASVQESNEGSYEVVVTNVVGSVTSARAALSVNNPIQITAQPAAMTVNPAAIASFSVSASGTGPITYQWRKDLAEIGGATNASYAIAPAQESSEGSYDVVVTNAAGSVTSTPALLSVNDPIQITDQPVAKTVNPEASASFSVSAAGTDPITYQWRKNSVEISGATAATYTILSAQESSEGSYDVVVKNVVGSVASTPAVLSVNDPLQITGQPVATTVNPAASVSFSVTVDGTGPITYQWRKNSATIGGATSMTYTVSLVSESDEGSYDVVVTNIAGSLASNPAVLAVNDPIQVTLQPVSRVVNEEGTTSFSVSAQGSAPLTYQWEHNGVLLNGATSATLTISNAVLSDEGSYRCKVANVVGAVLSDAALLEVRLRARIVEQPKSTDVKPNANVVFTVKAAGYAPLTYQWLKSGAILPDQTSSTLALSNVTALDAGRYSVKVTNEVNSIESAAADLRFVVWTDVDGTYQSLLLHDKTLDSQEPGSPGRLTVSVTGGGALSGKLEYRGISYSFAGKFTPELSFRKTISRKNQAALDLQMHLDAAGKKLGAQLEEALPAGVFQSEAMLSLQPVYSSEQPASQAGRYTLRIDPLLVIEGQPLAPGYAAVVVGASGAVRLTGKLPDGAILNSSALLHEDGSIAYYDTAYKSVYPDAGYLAGSLQFDREGGLDAVDGALEWKKPAGGRYWPLGFTQALTAEGSLFASPLRGQRVLNLSTGSDAFEFQSAALENSMIVRLSSANRLFADLPNAHQLKLTVNLSTGLIKGSFRETSSNKLRKLEGVTLQAQQEFSGFFLRDDNSSDWLLAPAQPAEALK